MKLKKYKLRKLCLPNQIGKYGIPAPAIAYSNGKIRYLRISDISEEGTLVNTDKKSVESDDIEQYILEENDIVFARTGNSTGRAYLYDKRDGVMAYAGFLIKYQLDEHKVNPIYLRYFTLSTFYKQWVANLSVGSTRGNISAQTFADCPIVLPPRHQQDVLVETLSNIDAKIKLNRQINDNLEAMAKQLYDYWFVQFDFPNEEGKPYRTSNGAMVWNEKLKREIPQGWDNGVLADVANITMGQSPDGSSYNENGEGVIFYQGSTDFGLRFPKIRQYTTASSRYANKGDILMSVRAPVGALNIANNNCCIGRGLSALSSKIGSMTHLYYLMNDFRLKFERMNSAGTTFGSITKDELLNLPVVIPIKSIISGFEKVCDPIFDKQMVIGEEINALTRLRDELLPLLMNGQASVNYHLSDD